MPTVLRWRGYRFFFFSNEGSEPAHIHVEKDEAMAKFWLETGAVARNAVFRRGKVAAGALRPDVVLHILEHFLCCFAGPVNECSDKP